MHSLQPLFNNQVSYNLYADNMLIINARVKMMINPEQKIKNTLRERRTAIERELKPISRQEISAAIRSRATRSSTQVRGRIPSSHRAITPLQMCISGVITSGSTATAYSFLWARMNTKNMAASTMTIDQQANSIPTDVEGGGVESST